MDVKCRGNDCHFIKQSREGSVHLKNRGVRVLFKQISREISVIFSKFKVYHISNYYYMNKLFHIVCKNQHDRPTHAIANVR